MEPINAKEKEENKQIEEHVLHNDDEATYLHRVKRVFHQLDIRTAFTSEEKLQHALKIVEDNKKGIKASSGEIWMATKIKNAVIHPDTGEKVVLPLRVSMIVPMNLILDAGMMSAATPISTIFWQWLNQTYNALHYYANRNASNHDTSTQRISAYVAATGSSVAAALGMRKLAESASPTAWWRPYARRLGPFAAVAAADILNLPLMRQSEFLKGVDVFDEKGQFIGKSKKAGVLAVSSCVAGRVFAAAPILCIPPLIMQSLEDRKIFENRRYLRMPTLLSLVAIMIQFSVPLTFGLFRQTARVQSSHLEREFHDLRRMDGSKLDVLFYNKGI